MRTIYSSPGDHPSVGGLYEFDDGEQFLVQGVGICTENGIPMVIFYKNGNAKALKVMPLSAWREKKPRKVPQISSI